MKRATLLQLSFLLLLLGASPSHGAAEQKTDRTTLAAETHFTTGLDHYYRGRYKEAVAALKQAILIKPDLPAAHYNLGLAYEKIGQYAEALKVYEQAVRLAPNDAAAYSRLGAMHNYFGQHVETVRSLQQAIRLKPNVASNYNVLGSAYYRMGQYKEAAAALEKGVRIAPDAATYQNLSTTYRKLGQTANAIAAQELAARLSSRQTKSTSETTRNGESNRSSAATAAPVAPRPTPQAQTPQAQTTVSFRAAADTTPSVPQEVARVEERPLQRANRSSAAERRATDTPPRRSRSTPSQPPPAANGTARNTRNASLSPIAATVAVSTTATSNTETPRAVAPAENEPTSATNEVTTANNALTADEAAKVESSKPVSTESESAEAETAKSTAVLPLTRVYRVGIGDTLDIRLLNAQTADSTLFTVLAGGLLDYPLAGKALPVAGLEPSEIAELLADRIKLYEKPEVVVSVREYASHAVTVSGLVSYPGTKVLRHEAVPLYVVLADAQPRTEAGRAVITSPTTGTSTIVALDEPDALNLLVHPNDVISIQARLPQFYYISGEVNQPGEKVLRPNTTLTQAVLAAGIFSRLPVEVEVSRKGADGATIVSRYNLRHIRAGKIPDPSLQAGDWIEVVR